MADQPKEPKTNPTNPDQPTVDPVPGREGPSVQDVNVPENPRKKTEDAAVKAIQESKKRDLTPSLEKGSDKAFNTWLRNAHENGNPEQLSPMQAEQNIRDLPQEQPQVNKIHDMSHEDTRWVVEHGLVS